MWILLLISIQNLHGLNCYSNGSLHFSRNEFNWNNFSNIINNFTHQTISNVASCHVRITVYYNSFVIIEFHPIRNNSNRNIEFGSEINFSENQIKLKTTYLDYTCSSGNLCDKIFLKQWSKQISDNSFHNSFLSLWDNSNICQRERKTHYCESYLCFVIYNELKDLSYGKSQCEDKLSTNPINIYITTTSKNIKNEYQCTKNRCTGELIYKYFILEKNSIEINSKNNQLNELNLKIIFIIVGILLIIGLIAYCIQCRKYKQGYRLTVNA